MPPPSRERKFEQNQYGITMLAVMSIVGIVVYTSLGRTSNDSGRVALRSTKIPLKNQHDLAPPIMMFDGYEIAPAYIEDRTDYACGDKTCYAGESCHQTNPSSQYVLVSSPGDYCASVGLEAITTPEECATAGTALNGSALPGVNRTFQTCNEGTDGCPDLTDYQAGNPCWITGTSGSLKFSDLYLNGTAGVTCGTVDPYDSLSSPSACVCKQTVDASSQCEYAQCDQLEPDNMTEFFTQVLIQHYGLNNVDNLHVSDGGDFTYKFRNHTFFGTRSDMLHCDGQTERLAVSRACQCQNGLASLFCDGQHGCEMCSSGFNMLDDGTCSPNQCDCTNGQGASGADCLVDGGVKCMGCEDGFRLENGLCEENTCFCNNGTAAIGAQCIQDGAEICTGCNTGFRLVNDTCVSNTCSCNNGTAVSGADCTQDAMFMCASCADGFNMLDDGTCILNQCDCTNGQGASGTHCEGYGATKCVSCNAGFRLENERCEENTCSCNNGTPANGTQCIEDGAEICSGCESGYSLEFGKCKPNVCYCDAGSNATGSECLEHGSAACSNCQPGYTLHNGSCVMHVCSCNYGVEAHGTECPINNEPKCMSCNPGLILDANHACVCADGFNMNENGTCSPNQCICPDVNGIPATGVECPENGAEKCEGCEDGFRLVTNTCVPNTCFCNNGTAATGDKCTENDAEICTDCTSGFTLIGNACVKNVCKCDNGIAVSGTQCTQHEMHKCASCADGYYLWTSKDPRYHGKCFLKKCDCNNGVGANGTNCNLDINDGKNCASCYSGYDRTEIYDIQGVYFCDTCHPSDATVVVQYACDTGLCLAQRRMDDLNMGDMVETGSNVFEPVIAFTHRETREEPGKYLSFEFANSSLEISPTHYMYANGKRVLPIYVNKGDILSNGEKVEYVRIVYKKGSYHPHTWSTKLIVNGVKTSTNSGWMTHFEMDYIFTPIAQLLYYVGYPVDFAPDTKWAPLMGIPSHPVVQTARQYIPSFLAPGCALVAGSLMLMYVFPDITLMTMLTILYYKNKSK